jgi:predicted nucleic acid-binding protein
MIFISISPTTTRDAQYALGLDFKDFEDAMQVAAAIACRAEIILTRHVNHDKNSSVPVQTPQNYIKTHLSKIGG